MWNNIIHKHITFLFAMKMSWLIIIMRNATAAHKKQQWFMHLDVAYIHSEVQKSFLSLLVWRAWKCVNVYSFFFPSMLRVVALYDPSTPACKIHAYIFACSVLHSLQIRILCCLSLLLHQFLLAHRTAKCFIIIIIILVQQKFREQEKK